MLSQLWRYSSPSPRGLLQCEYTPPFFLFQTPVPWVGRAGPTVGVGQCWHQGHWPTGLRQFEGRGTGGQGVPAKCPPRTRVSPVPLSRCDERDNSAVILASDVQSMHTAVLPALFIEDALMRFLRHSSHKIPRRWASVNTGRAPHTMPKINICGRSFPVSSDDFVFSGMLSTALRAAWVVIIAACLAALNQHHDSCR